MIILITIIKTRLCVIVCIMYIKSVTTLCKKLHIYIKIDINLVIVSLCSVLIQITIFYSLI